MELSNTNYDFAGWATCCNKLCSDGRTIMPDAFKHHDGEIVPLVWNHQHNDPNNILGKALLHSVNGSIYAYCAFNDTESGKVAKELVEHGDVTALSIYANQLKHNNNRGVTHGVIRELSIVLAGANPEAYIDSIIKHGEDSDEEAIIYTNDDNSIELYHADNKDEDDEEKKESEEKSEEKSEEPEEKAEESKEESEDSEKEESTKPEIKHAEDSEEVDDENETISDILNTLTEKQQNAVLYVFDQLINEEADEDEANKEEESNMKHNVFDIDNNKEEIMMHTDIINNAIADAKRFGSLKESVLQHAAVNNITNIGELFPTLKDLNMPPEWIKEDESWVSKVMGSVHHTPFSRVRALFGQMDEAEARARGYIKGKEKANIKLAILKRTTQPTTVYVKMKMDRDDIVDIADFDVVAWQKAEMRKQLDRELARAFLIGDGREPGDDKIDETCIRPVVSDEDMFTIKYTVTDGSAYHNDFNSASENDSEAKGVIRAAVKARKNYKGSGKPTFFTTEDLLTELLLIEDQNGRRIYESEAALATAMRVKEIVTVPEMESHTDIYGIIVNMADYNTGADKGGAVAMFDDFDIDYNQQKYLMETRCSGALVRPYSAIVLKKASVEG